MDRRYDEMSLKFEIDFGKYISKIWSLIKRFGIGHLLLLALALHMFAIASTPDSMVFDEVHYVPAAEATLNLQAANMEHTPLVKIIVAFSMRIFGDWWFAWRFPIVLFSVASLLVFYYLAKRFMPTRYALLATAFLAFDVMFFVNGSIFILDIPAIFFGLLGIELYFGQRYNWCAIAFALSFLCKELGLLFMFSILLYHLIAKLRIGRSTVTEVQDQEIVSATTKKPLGSRPKTVEKKVWRSKGLAKKGFATFLIASLVFLLVAGGGLWIYDAVFNPGQNATLIKNIRINVVQDQNGSPVTSSTWTESSTRLNPIQYPWQNIEFALSYFTSLVPAVQTPDSEYRPPWGWVLPLNNIFNSPHYLTVSVTVGSVTHKTIDWVSQINPLISYAFVPLLALCIVDFARKRGKEMDYLYLAWGLVAFMPWLIDQLVSRMTFNYYFLYTVPVICLGLGWGYSRLAPRISNRYVRYGLICAHLIAVILFFMWFFPLSLFR
jgi:hypothetical protein